MKIRERKYDRKHNIYFIKLNLDIDLWYLKLFVNPGDYVTYKIRVSSEVQSSLVRSIKQEKEPEIITGKVMETYWKQNILYLKVLKDTRYYCFKLTKESELKLYKKKTLLNSKILNVLYEISELTTFSARVIDSEYAYDCKFEGNEFKILDKESYSMKEPDCFKKLAQHSLDYLITIPVFKKYFPSKKLVIVPRIEEDCYKIIQEKEVKNLFNQKYLNKQIEEVIESLTNRKQRLVHEWSYLIEELKIGSVYKLLLNLDFLKDLNKSEKEVIETFLKMKGELVIIDPLLVKQYAFTTCTGFCYY